MDDNNSILLYGASGHAKVVFDLVRRSGLWQIVALLDDNRDLQGTTFCGVTISGGREALPILMPTCAGAIVAVGDNVIRRRIAGQLAEQGLALVTACHPQASVADDVVLGAGTVVMAGAVINPACRVGDNCIVNTQASIDHDCLLGSHTHIAPGVTICGGVTIGEGAFIGAGATVVPNVTIGIGATVGAGSTVVNSVPPGVTVIGTPARLLKC